MVAATVVVASSPTDRDGSDSVTARGDSRSESASTAPQAYCRDQAMTKIVDHDCGNMRNGIDDKYFRKYGNSERWVVFRHKMSGNRIHFLGWITHSNGVAAGANSVSIGHRNGVWSGFILKSIPPVWSQEYGIDGSNSSYYSQAHKGMANWGMGTRVWGEHEMTPQKDTRTERLRKEGRKKCRSTNAN